MNRLNNLQGSIVAIVTPFNSNGSIDYVSYEGLLNDHLKAGTSAIITCGTTGETPSLTENEYRELIRFTVKKIKGKIPIIAGSGTFSTGKTIHYSNIAKKEGVDGLLIVGPYYVKPTPQGFYKHYLTVAKAVNLPIIIYNVPARTGSNIPVSIILKLAHNIKNITAVKEASGDMAQIMGLLQEKPKNFKVYLGDDALTLAAIALGADGCISVVANEIPRQFALMVRLALRGKIKEARKIHNKYLNLMNLNFIESSPIPVKTALAMMGKIKESFRLPMCPMEQENKAILAKELQKLGLLKK